MDDYSWIFMLNHPWMIIHGWSFLDEHPWMTISSVRT
jgi:hypothetical protein